MEENNLSNELKSKLTKQNFTSSFYDINKLKRKNVIYQVIGFLVLISIFFIDFKYFFITNFIGIIILSIITLKIILLSRKIISINYSENENKIVMTLFSKKEKTYKMDKLSFSINKKEIIIQDLKGNLLVQIDNDKWSNFNQLIDLFQSKSKEIKIPKSTFKGVFKGVFKEILTNEIKDPTGF